MTSAKRVVSRPLRVVGAGACLLVGLALCAWLVCATGAARLLVPLRAFLPWVPALFALESARVGAELLSTVCVLGRDATRVSLRQLVRLQLGACALCAVMPAGRAVGEAAKATWLAPTIGAGRAMAVGAAGQSIALLVNALWAVLGVVIGWRAGTSPTLLHAMMGYAAVTGGAVGFMLLCVRAPALATACGRWPAVRDGVSQLATLTRTGRRDAAGAISAQLLARALQAAQIGLLVRVLGGGASLAATALAHALYVLGAAAGELVPAQLGAVEGAFAVAAPVVGLSRAGGLAVGLAIHAVGLGAAAIFALVALSLSRRWGTATPVVAPVLPDLTLHRHMDVPELR